MSKRHEGTLGGHEIHTGDCVIVSGEGSFTADEEEASHGKA
jgi:hypothetical protein